MTIHREKICVECGTPYTPYHTTISKYCSKLCQWRNRKRHHRSVHPSTEQQRADHRDYNHKYYERKGEEIRSQAQKWYRDNRERSLENMKKWQNANPDQMKIHRIKRRIAKMGRATENRLTIQEWKALIWAYGGKCAYCGRLPTKITQDHVVALSRGGTHTDDNVVPACLPCNMSKGAKDVADFLYELYRKPPGEGDDDD